MNFLKYLIIFLTITNGIAQEETSLNKYTQNNKGKIFIYWGGNRGYFSDSDIHFKGENYDFILHDVIADDRPKGWHIDYINPVRMTIPQTNLRVGYFVTNRINVSLGIDHMKYVMRQNQVVNYTGEYPNRGSYNEDINPGQVLLTEEFLTFEHTDGLNYVNTEVTYVHDFSKWVGIHNTDKVQLNFNVGLGGGVLYPKSNSKILGKQRYDNFHVSGYGIATKAGLNFTFFKHFFIQTELKHGYINMPNIRTTVSSVDQAAQDFTFLETVIALGAIFRL
ncbi:MAG: hypothetical protein Q4B43_05965 [Bacteroidota bacterium]|nr:hypothetical protein [Bacteroidota bacterium]